MGGPGAGKGTQCAKLCDEFGVKHLSAGDLLRQERASGSENGQMIDEFIREGKIVPVAVSLGLIKTAMDNTIHANIFLIDGFPRNKDNVQGWNDFMADSAHVLCTMFFDCSQEEQERRLLNRGLTSGRSDDNIQSARKRFLTYTQETLPVIDYFDNLGILKRIPAENPPEEVYKITREVVANYLSQISP